LDFTIPPAATKYGHSASVSAKLTPELFREIQAHVQSGRFPYRTNSDLMRHALYLHMRSQSLEMLEKYDYLRPRTPVSLRPSEAI
jgi:hypothetical protein